MRQRLAVKSSLIGIFANLSTILINFITTRFFVHYLGVELLGINGVFSNVLGFLQLAELGIGTAITYALYQPVVDGDTREIRILMQFYRKIYRYICLVILILGAAMTPFLTFFVEDATCSDSYLVLIYLIQLGSIASTYLLAYKRNLLYADQKQYITTFIDALLNVCCCILRISVILWLKSYVAYLVVLVLQNVVSNLIIACYCNRSYPYLRDRIPDRYDKMDLLKANVKNLMIGRMGGWVYNSTDHLLISKFVGIMAVGVMANFYTLKMVLNSLAGSIVAPIQPMIGNYIRKCGEQEKIYRLFLNYSFIRFCLANLIGVGFTVMGNRVVEIWLGKDYLVPEYIVLLLAIDLFISVAHGATGDFIQVLGLFKNDRNMSLAGMIINLGTSLVLVQFWGIGGVLLGTVTAQCYYWIARGSVVFRRYFRRGAREYILKIAKYVLSTAVEILLLKSVFSLPVFAACNIPVIVLQCVLCAVCSAGVIAATNFYTEEWSYAVSVIKRYAGKVLGRGSSTINRDDQ